MQATTTQLPVPDAVGAPKRRLIWGLCAGLLVRALILLAVSLLYLKLDGDITYPESEIVYLSLLAAKTGHLYRPLSQPPYSPAPYGPGLYLALAGVERTAGLPMDGLELAGRMLVLASFAALAGLIVAWGKQLTGSRLAAAAGCLFLLAQPDIFPWQVTVRPDFLALLFSCCGLWLCAVFRDERRLLVLAGACFGLAVLTKQSFVAAPLAVAVVLAWERRWKELMVVAGVAALLAGGILGLLLLRGDSVVSNLFLLSHSDIEWRGAVNILRDELLAFDMRWILLLLAGLGAAHCWRSRGFGPRVLALYCALAWLQGVVLLLHVGSNYNVLLEPWAASSLLAAVAVKNILASTRRVNALMVVAGGLLLAHGIYNAFPLPRPDALPRWGFLAPVVQGRRVLTDNPYLAARSADPVMLDPYFNSILEQNGVWDSAPIRARLAQGDFGLVVLTVYGDSLSRYRGLAFFSEAVLKEIGKNYRLICHAPLKAGYSAAFGIPKANPPDSDLQLRLREAGCR